MTSLMSLLVDSEYYLSARRTIKTNASMKNGKSALIYYSDTTNTSYRETLVPLCATC